MGSGSTTPLLMSRLSSGRPIFALSNSLETLRKLTLCRGVVPLYFDSNAFGADEVDAQAIEFVAVVETRAGHRGAVETPIGAPGKSIIFRFDREGPRPWVAVLMLDPRLSWAGAPGEAMPLRNVLVKLPSGTYTLEWIRTGPDKPRTRDVVSDGSITVGPEPVYLIPKR